MKLRRRYMTRRHAASVDVTAFLSLMVILLPFLLITAVFSRITILELQGASTEPAVTAGSDPLQLQVVVRDAVIEVRHRGLDEATHLPRTPGGDGILALADLVQELKGRFPDSHEATILLEPQVVYDIVVQVMDAVRIRQYRQEGGVVHQELFPQIALGDAPDVGRAPRDRP